MGAQMKVFRRIGTAIRQMWRASDTRKAPDMQRREDFQPVAASRAREMLERIRSGEYEFSVAEINGILKKVTWLGAYQSWFESLSISRDHCIEVRLRVPHWGSVVLKFLILDLWHDHRVSSIDFQIRGILPEKWRNTYVRRFMQGLCAGFVYTVLHWNGSWRMENLRFVLRGERKIRLYVEWPEKKSPLLGNISVIGMRIKQNSLVFFTFRRSAEPRDDFRMAFSGGDPGRHSTALSRVAVMFSWILLGAYAFVLVHVTLPVLGGAFQLMPQGATALHIWILTQIYNLCVILVSYFFLRITMLPLYLKWNKSREDLATLSSLEERDHQYLRPLTELVRKMQQAGKPTLASGPTVGEISVTAATIAQMIELMSTIREQSRQRLLGMTKMRRGWLQDLLIGYVFIFSLEWMYYKGLLTPLSVSIKWVNRIMAALFLPD